jgi:UDP-N-acetylglucosamine 2-epimerase (non-hydrolysing)
MKTVAVVYGTRPEAIKLAPLIIELKRIPSIETVVICTGQHKEMLQGILEIWGLKNDYLLDSNFASSHSSAIPNLMINLEKLFLEVSPDLVVVQGDTATATAGALQAHALHIKIAHVEAGLRSGDLWNPWPEESNRRIVDSVASLHFAPTKSAAKNLEREGCGPTTTVTGNTVVDALIHASKELEGRPEIQRQLESLLGFSLERDFILFTQHRREGFGDGQEKVFGAILELAKSGHKIVFPVHLNPLVRDKVNEMLLNQPGIHLISPQEYLPFLALLRKCSLIISDSGGLQEEAPTFGKRILITRLTTERPEVIESGFGQLVGYDSENIIKLAAQGSEVSNQLKLTSNPFGDGDSSKIITESIVDALGLSLGKLK